MNEDQKKIADRLREILIVKLRLPISKEEFTYDIPFFEDGLELDSLDAMEIVVIVDNEYDVELTSEQRSYFKNLTTLSGYILEEVKHKSK